MYLELRAYLGGQTFDRSIDLFINDFEDGMREFWGVEVDDEADIIQDKRHKSGKSLESKQFMMLHT